jgi:hypothetical protein
VNEDAKEKLKRLLAFAATEDVLPIIVGDFNWR